MSREGVEAPSKPIQGKEDLLGIFKNGARPRDQFALGLEMEQLGVDSTSGRALVFDGDRGIEQILKAIVRDEGWQPTMDQNRLIGATFQKAAVTLEPGGQLELSGAPHVGLENLSNEVMEHVARLKKISGQLGISWLGLGLSPVTPVSQMNWVPKSRYRIMRAYYEKRGGLAWHMMLSTASIQANLDYESEADARKKVRIASVLGPVIGAMFANSAVEEGAFNGFCTRRLKIWTETDADRCGTPSFFVDGSFSFEKYMDFALDVPMYFVLRSGNYVDKTGKTFRQFLADTNEGATHNDWVNHLTTLFPDVRLKDHLEFRTADSVKPALAVSLLAFWKGLLYDPMTMDSALERLKNVGLLDIQSATHDVSLKGLQAHLGGEPIVAIARDMVELARVGLSRQDRLLGKREIKFLEPLMEVVERGSSPAEEIRKTWNGDFSQLRKMVE